jgi:UDP-N-acetylmuramyl pentapeptide phosphotransferase/UDP-N-acetylglucosamine-1-phosphate transferase
MCVLISIALTKLYCYLADDTPLMDKPNQRSSHLAPTVRGGGLVFIGLLLIMVPFIAYEQALPLVEGAILFTGIFSIAAVSFIDDFYHLSIKPRLFAQSAAAIVFSLYFFPEQLDLGLFVLHGQVVITLFIVITILWGINHFNFMDGIDGLCASQAIFLLLTYAVLFNSNEAIFYEYLCLFLTFNLMGFLFFNFPPAKLFMGDVGSATLGFITLTLAVVGQSRYSIPFWYWFILNSLFLFDSTVTLIRRILNHEHWASPHRKHAYQRLKLMGVNNRLILLGQLCINCLMFLMVLCASRWHIPAFILLIVSLLLLSFVYLTIEKYYPMHSEQ